MHEAKHIDELDLLVYDFETSTKSQNEQYVKPIVDRLKKVSIPVQYVYYRKLYLNPVFKLYVDIHCKDLLMDIAKWKGRPDIFNRKGKK